MKVAADPCEIWGLRPAEGPAAGRIGLRVLKAVIYVDRVGDIYVLTKAAFCGIND